jgi:hypothetical protein
MTDGHRLRCYDYVNQPDAKVRAALLSDAPGIFARATTTATERERSIGVQLHVHLGPLDVATDVHVEVGTPKETMSTLVRSPMTVFPLSWSAVKTPSLFPRMRGTLSVYPLSQSETQLEFEGVYDPPLGLLGDAIDAMAGHRIAEASVLQFVRDVAALLRSELAKPPAADRSAHTS